MNLAIIVMAAGKGSRMKSSLPKVLHPVARFPIIWHILTRCQGLKASRTIVITGHGGDQVEEYVANHFDGIEFIRQHDQLGTGHAVLQTKQALENFDGHVMVLNGDVPLIPENTLTNLMETHLDQDNAVTLTATTMADPTGLGRVIMDSHNQCHGVVEHKDASPGQLTIKDVNVGFYAAKAPLVYDLLARVSNDNAQGEYYLPDIIPIALSDGYRVGVSKSDGGDMLLGINTRKQLAHYEEIFQTNARDTAMLNGVTLRDTDTTFFAADTQLGRDVTIGPGTTFGPSVKIDDNVQLEGQSFISNCTIASGSHIYGFSHIDGADIGENAEVGPFARLRKGTVLGENALVGNFVETKQTTLGKNSKAKHLSYLGNIKAGDDVNIGAGTISANYHAFKKEKNIVTLEDGASIGANNTLVAPTNVGKGAFTGAGTTIRKDVPAGSLAVSKTEVALKPGYMAAAKKTG